MNPEPLGDLDTDSPLEGKREANCRAMHDADQKCPKMYVPNKTVQSCMPAELISDVSVGATPAGAAQKLGAT
jgi:hypothetical protein